MSNFAGWMVCQKPSDERYKWKSFSRLKTHLAMFLTKCIKEKMINYVKFTVLILLIATSCQQNNIPKTKEIFIDFKLVKTKPLSSIIKATEYVQIGNIENKEIIFPYRRLSVMPDKKGFIVLELKSDTKEARIFSTNRKGEVLCSLVAQEGPESIAGTSDVRYFDNGIYVLNYFDKKLARYSMQCEPQEVFHLPKSYVYFQFVKKNYVALDADNRPNPEDPHLLNVYNLSAGVSTPHFVVNYKNPVGETMERYYLGEELLFFRQHDNNIYKITDEGVEAKYQVLFSQDLWLDENTMNSPEFYRLVNEEGKMFKIFNVREKNSKILFFLIRNRQFYWVISDTKNQETEIFSIVNDVDGLDLKLPLAYGDPDEILFSIPAPEFSEKMKNQPLPFAPSPYANEYLAIYRLNF